MNFYFHLDYSTQRPVGLDRKNALAYPVQCTVLPLHRKGTEVHGRGDWTSGRSGSFAAAQSQKR